MFLPVWLPHFTVQSAIQKRSNASNFFSTVDLVIFVKYLAILMDRQWNIYNILHFSDIGHLMHSLNVFSLAVCLFRCLDHVVLTYFLKNILEFFILIFISYNCIRNTPSQRFSQSVDEECLDEQQFLILIKLTNCSFTAKT